MPKGDIHFKSGGSTHYDDFHDTGDNVVFKRSYSHEVQVVAKSDVKAIEKNEWHQTPFGSCKSLSNSEINEALEKAKNR